MMKNIFTTIILFTGLLLSFNVLAADEEVGDFIVEVLIENADCTGVGGFATFEISGGEQPYSLGHLDQIFIVEGSTFTLSNLVTGPHSVSIFDNTGCVQNSFFIIEINELTVSFECTGQEDSIIAIAEGGTPPYSYSWSNGVVGQEISNLDDGIYTVTVTDSEACWVSQNYIHSSFDGTLSCNQLINLSVGQGATITPEMLIEGPFSFCDTDMEFNLSNEQGEVLAPFASSHTLDCSNIGQVNYTLKENTSGFQCNGSLIVEDKSSPIPFCLSGISILLDENQEREIFAAQLDAGSYDNCSENLRYTFSSTPPDSDPDFDPTMNSSSMIVDCNFTLGLVELSIYVWDEYNNFDFCLATILVSDSDNPCAEDGSFLSIENGLCNTGEIDRYSILLNGTEIDNLGCFYDLDNSLIVDGTNVVSITNTENSSFLNGISTIDLVLSINGLINGYDDPLLAVLADFDGDLAVSTQDLILQRLSILGIIDEIDAPYYKMFPIDYEFPDDFNQFNQLNSYTTYEFDSSEAESIHRMSILKSGDLNNSALFTSEITSSTRSEAKIKFDDINMQAGETYLLEFEASADDAFQAATFELNAVGLEFKSIDSQVSDILENINTNSAKLSFVDFNETDSFSFTLEVTATQNISASDALSINDEFLNEVGFGDLSLSSFSLSANDLTAVENVLVEDLVVFPNPTNDFVNLAFGNSFIGMEKNVEIISLDGKIIFASNTNKDQLNIELSTLQTTGMHLVKVQVADKNILKKLIIK